jgi:hypothetical protein
MQTARSLRGRMGFGVFEAQMVWASGSSTPASSNRLCQRVNDKGSHRSSCWKYTSLVSVGVLQVQQPHHHPYWQRSTPSVFWRRRQQIRDLLDDALPGHRIRKPDQWVIRPDDLIQTSPTEIVSAVVS